MAGTIHITGPYTEGVQQCARCLEILIDNRDVDYPEGSKPPGAFAEGERVTVRKERGSRGMTIGADDGAEHCKPMRVSL
jgi:hypothetical protein